MPADYEFTANAAVYDIRAYPDLGQWLVAIWEDAFHIWDAKISTPGAQDIASRVQDRAELFWVNYHDGAEGVAALLSRLQGAVLR